MPGFVTCPNCREELDIPAELRGRPVRCAACGTAFTPPADDTPVAAPRASRAPRDEVRDEPRDNPRDGGERDPRDERLDERRPRVPPRRRSNAWVWLMLFGTFGVCCLGCGGALIWSVTFVKPELIEYKAPDGRFDAGFPGLVTVATKPATGPGVEGATTTYEHNRTVLGNTVDTYFIRAIEMRRKPNADEVKRLVKKALDGLHADGSVLKTTPASLDGVPGQEVQVALRDAGMPQTLVARAAVIGDRLYVVGVRGQNLRKPEEQMRVAEFWNAFTARAAQKEAGDDNPFAPDKPVPDDE